MCNKSFLYINKNLKNLFLLICILYLFTKTSPTHAHPHIFAEARLNVVLNPDSQTITALQHVWRFDEIFSSSVLMDFDQNRDGKIDKKESEKIRTVIYNSLKDYNYFQSVSVNGKEISMNAPKDFVATFEDNKLMVMFEAEPKTVLKAAGRIGFRIYDPSFYTAIEFIDDNNMAISMIPEKCSRHVIHPTPNLDLAQNSRTLTESFFENPKNDISKIFSKKLELNCPA